MKFRFRHATLSAIPVFVLGMLCCNAAYAAAGKFAGVAELMYLDYKSTSSKNSDTYEANSFTQRYAFDYKIDTRKQIRSNRSVEYDLLVGYEWLSADASINSNGKTLNPSFRNGRLFYKGKIDYDPTNMPLRLTAYANDMQRPTFETTVTPAEGILQSELPVGVTVRNGIHLQSGTTITFGEKSGLTRNYGKLFSYIPLMLLDYSQSIDKEDRADGSRVDNRTRRLAFVSLNKKDNWIHYRTTKFEDFVTTLNNWQQTEYQLGTIGPSQSRVWVDMANWIKISADAQLTKYEANDYGTNYDEYSLNLFTLAARKSWQARIFSSFTRRNEYTRINLDRNLPVYISGVLGADTDWAASILVNDRQEYAKDANQGTTLRFAEERRGITLTANTYKRSMFTVSPKVSIQHLTTLTDKLLDLSGAVNLTSTRRFSAVHNVGLNYDVRVHLNSADTPGSDYMDQMLNGSWGFFVSDRFRVSLTQGVSLTSTLNGKPAASANGLDVLNSGQLVTTGQMSWALSSRSSASLTAGNSKTFYLSGGDGDSRQYVQFALNGKTEVLNGGVRASWNQTQSSGSGKVENLEANCFLDYTPTKDFVSTVYGRVNLARANGLDAGTAYDFRLKSRYDIYPTAFTGRPIVQLEGEFLFTQLAYGDETGSARVQARYFPYSRISLTGYTSVSFLGPATQVFGASAALDMRFFQSSLDYSYGRRTSDQRIDKRFTASVRRAF